MKKFACPSCGAEVEFVSSASVYAVCKFCSSMIVRHDLDVESIGSMAALPEDMSPFQVGTEGYYGDLHFTLAGRMKIGWEDGSWNEWFMVADDGRRGWLAEAQGFYAICFEVEPPPLEFAVRAVKSLKDGDAMVGTHQMLDGMRYRIVDCKAATCIGSEGELPFAAPKGRKTLSVDLLGAKGQFGCIEIETAKIRAFAGRYVDWQDLRCTHERKFDGW